MILQQKNILQCNIFDIDKADILLIIDP